MSTGSYYCMLGDFPATLVNFPEYGGVADNVSYIEEERQNDHPYDGTGLVVSPVNETYVDPLVVMVGAHTHEGQQRFEDGHQPHHQDLHKCAGFL